MIWRSDRLAVRERDGVPGGPVYTDRRSAKFLQEFYGPVRAALERTRVRVDGGGKKTPKRTWDWVRWFGLETGA